MTVFAVIHKTGFERGFNAGDNGFVDIAFALFAAFDFSFEVQQFLSVNNGQAPFFRLRGIDQHALHEVSTFTAEPNRDGDRSSPVWPEVMTPLAARMHEQRC